MIWVLGPSMCLPWSLDDPESGWPTLLSKKLNIPLTNLAEEAVDNFFIFNRYLEIKDQIQPNDILIIGWSHPSRKTFVLDRTNSNQTDILKESLYYKTKNYEFIRSNNISNPDSLSKFANMRAILKSGRTKYFDTWYKDYYNDREQVCNFQAYLDSVFLNSNKGKYFPFFINEDSIKGITTNLNFGYMMNFILKHNVAISDSDFHWNEKGHRLWANYLYTQITK